MIDLSIELDFNIYICNTDKNLKNRLIIIFYLFSEICAQEKNIYIAVLNNYLISYYKLFAVSLASEFCALYYFLTAEYILFDAF